MDAAGSPLAGRPVSWSSDNRSVVTVDGSGLVTGVGAGTTAVIATSEGKSGSATITVPSHPLNVAKTGTGSGTVTSSPAGIDCGEACTADFAEGTVVTLAAAPAAGSVFVQWSGACSGMGATCQVSVGGATAVTAHFELELHALSVVTAGTGAGAVTSSPPGIDCGEACTADFASGTVVTLTAAPLAGSVFVEWSGACAGSEVSCQVTMDAPHSVAATFELQHLLSVTKMGTGSGTVTTSPAGIDCGSQCSANFGAGTLVTLTASPAIGSVFEGWGGACSGTAATCQTIMNAAQEVMATFEEREYTLTVTKEGTGSGTVTSSPAGIDCGNQCSAGFGAGTMVTLTASPAVGSVFAGWSGGCSGAEDACQVTMDAGRAVTATFVPLTYPLIVTLAGTGSGTVTSDPAGIDCGGTCSASYGAGVNVTLTATPAAGSVWGGWSGACSGMDAECQVAMDAARDVTATFNILGLGFGPEQFAQIPAGNFQMGDAVGDGFVDELPVHTVNITHAFYIQRTEVTQSQWREVMGTDPSEFDWCGDVCPVEKVSWDDVQVFLSALNAMDPGKNYRLPTEAEWEYACRAGTTGDYGGNGVLDDMGWYGGNSAIGSQLQTHPVARKLANAWGLFDMHGNVSEWVQDWYAWDYYSISPVDDPEGPATGTTRLVRGGAWQFGASEARSAIRPRNNPTVRYAVYGFRLVREK